MVEQKPPRELLNDREMDVLIAIADGLANKEIAMKLMLSYDTIRWYAKRIYQKLDVSSRTEAVSVAHKIGILGDDATLQSRAAIEIQLPQFLSEFVGREKDLEAVTSRLLDDGVRLVSIVGPGGIGKTRVGVEVASQNISHFTDGVFFIPMNDPQIALETFNETLQRTLHIDANTPSKVVDTLATKKMLLLFDNFEQSVDQNKHIAALLDRTQHLKILITSQVPINLQQEWLYRMEGLSITDPTADESDAIALFVARAQQMNHQFDPSLEHDAIQQLCEVLNGYPLAIELAATWVRSLSCAELLEEVQQNMDLLASTAPDLPERHRSIRAAFEHAWQLLDEDQRRAMRRLAVFPTVFGSDAAKQVGDIAIGTLARLVDRSLITKHGTGLYQIHEVLRQYALEKLQDKQTHATKSHVAIAMHALIKKLFEKVMFGV